MNNIIDFYDNNTNYRPPCCRPGGRCTKPHNETPDVPLSEDDEHRLSEFILAGHSMLDVLAYWRELKENTKGAGVVSED